MAHDPQDMVLAAVGAPHPFFVRQSVKVLLQKIGVLFEAHSGNGD
jgi:hypothetical protein